MIPYIALLFIPLFIQSILSISRKKIRIGAHDKTISADDVALPTFFVLFFLLLVLRDDTLGRDLPNYSYIFRSYGGMALRNILANPREIVFKLYCWIVYNCISHDFQVFVAVTACLSVAPIAYVYNQDKNHGYLKITVFVNMSTFIMLFSGIRQGLAMSSGMMAYQALKDHKTGRFYIWAIVAMFIHHTGFLTFLLYPLYKMRLQKRDMVWIAPWIVAILVFSRQIFNFLAALIGNYDESYAAVAESTGAIASFILFILFSIFCYVIEDETQMDEEAFALRNILTFAAVMQIFASLNPLAMRLNYYFILLIPCALGKAMRCVKPKYKQVAQLGELVIAAYFTYLFVSSTYRSYITGISTLDTIPYIPFWKG